MCATDGPPARGDPGRTLRCEEDGSGCRLTSAPAPGGLEEAEPDGGQRCGGAKRCRLDKGLKGKSKSTVDNYKSMAGNNLIPQIGTIKLKELTADRLDVWVDERAGELSTRSLRLIHQILERSIRHAQARDKVRRNVASLITFPRGRPVGRLRP
jgi:hypothetical protein